jgi:glycosyltransferase involved in cell wall biosynthesis
MKTIYRLDPDVVWFNLIFTTFGHNPAVAFSGLSLPWLARMFGCYTHVTLHHLMDGIDLEDAAVRHPRVYRAAGAVATKMLLLANSVSVLMPAYRNILHRKYRGKNVHLRPHGIFTARPEYPDFSRRGNPDLRILAFGKWGTYKRLEPLLDAFPAVAERLPNARFVVAGGDHPRTPGYVASLAQRYATDSRITFTGYVAEDAVADLFRSASIAVMPYSSSTGSSGVAHLACAYGVPIVSADIPDFRDMAREEGMAIAFYDLNDPRALPGQLAYVLQSEQLQLAMAQQNFSAALRMTMPQIVHQYVRHFELTRGARTLRPVMRMRKLPRWMPAPFLGNAMARNLRGWAFRPGLAPARHGEHGDGFDPTAAGVRPFASSSGHRNGNGRTPEPAPEDLALEPELPPLTDD